MKKLFVTAICILCSHWLLAGEIWISPKGSDFNDGTRQSPKATLTSALRQAREWRRTKTAALAAFSSGLVARQALAGESLLSTIHINKLGLGGKMKMTFFISVY